jgi:hypothetical protein
LAVTAEDASARRRVRAAATGAVVGIALSVAVEASIGGILTAVSMVYLVWALHRFGRLGADEPLHDGRNA